MTGFVDTDGTLKMCGSPPAGAMETHCGECGAESHQWLGHRDGLWRCRACYGEELAARQEAEHQARIKARRGMITQEPPS